MSASLTSNNSGTTAAISSGFALRQFVVPAMGSQCTVQYAVDLPWAEAKFERIASSWLADFEARFSGQGPDSLVSRINSAAGKNWVEVDEETEQFLRLCDAVHLVSRGMLDPTAQPLTRLWSYEVDEPVIPAPEELAGARQLVGWTKVQREPGRIFLPLSGMALDFSGFARDYAADVVAQLAVSHGIRDVLVEFGTAVRALGQPAGRPAWHVGLAIPLPVGLTAEGIGISARGVAWCSDDLQTFVTEGRRRGHLIDPCTGTPLANDCRRSMAIANTCLQARALATTALLLGRNEGLEYLQSFPTAEGVLAANNGSYATRGFLSYVAAA